MTTTSVSLVFLWIAVGILSVVVLALARQIGVLHERIAPLGALLTGGGPEVGDQAPEVLARLLDGSYFSLGQRLDADKSQLLLFIAANCPICKKIIPLAKSVAEAERLELIFVGDAEAAEQRILISKHGLEGYRFVNGPELGTSLHVGQLPYGVLVNDAGVIAAKGLVNTREHLESLVVAKSSGFASVQAYIKAKTAATVVETT